MTRMTVKTVNINFDAVRCNPAHCTSTGKGWAKLLRRHGVSESDIKLLVTRLRNGMAAEIELGRIKWLAGERK